MNQTVPALDAVTDLTAELMKLMREYNDEFSPIELARYFVKVRRVKDAIEAETKAFDGFYEELAKQKIPQTFEAHGVPSVVLDEGYRVTVSHSLRASIRGGLKEQAHAWLRGHGLGDIVTETVNAQTLTGVAKTMAEENQELPTDIFNVAVLANTSFNRVKGR